MKINKLKESLLSQELLKELLRYEYETGLFYWIKSGKGRKISQPAGNVSQHGYVVIVINGERYFAHRLTWLYVYGEFPQEDDEPFIDHINKNRADNRLENLRVSSAADNQKNKHRMSNNTSGVNGVNRESSLNGSGTRVNYYWVASWYNENGKLRHKYFSIETHGEGKAKQLAIVHRVEQLQLLEIKFGIKYSESHGV